MADQEKKVIGRRGFLGLLATGSVGAAAGAAASLGAEAIANAEMVSESRSDKRKARYRVTADVSDYYRVNRYPPGEGMPHAHQTVGH